MKWVLVSVRPNRGPSHHRFVATFSDGVRTEKTTRFGHKDYQCYLDHKDKARRQRYRIRHMKDLQTMDPTRAGYLSWYLLWGDSTSLEVNIKAYKKKFGL